MSQIGAVLVLVFLMLVLHENSARKLPPDFKICKRDDKDLSNCLKSTIEDALSKLSNGIESLHVPPLQPLEVPQITNGEGHSPIILTYTNYRLFGLASTKVKTLDAKLTPNSLDMKMETFSPEIKTEAEYTAKGTSMSIPINGKGNCTVMLERVKGLVTIHAESFEKKDKKYLKVDKFTLDIIPEKVSFNFENIVNGNEALSKELNKVMNENWKTVYDDVDDDFNAALQTVFQDYANRIFTQVPYDELF